MRILEKIALLREKMEMCKETRADPRSLGVGPSRGLLSLFLQAKSFLRHNCTLSFGAYESPFLGYILLLCLS